MTTDSQVRAVDEGVPCDATLTTVCPSNDEAFRRIAHLYARPGQTIIDPTFGKGVFWKQIDRSLYDLRASDIDTRLPGVGACCDLRALPYPDASADMVLLDPPYRYTPTKNVAHPALDDRYALQASAATRTQGVLELYVDGIREAARVLRPGGFAVVKCQDTVQDGRQMWVHVDLMAAGAALGFACRDILVVTPPSVTPSRWAVQRHLRKGHSYFLVLRLGGHFPFGIPSVQAR